ncbi:MAG: nitrilase-related carbon-nitrogen hydrolase, partial [Phycisphaerales bacterium]
MRAHLVQLNIAWENKEQNFARVRSLLDSTNISAGDLIVLPEMFDTGFSFNTDATGDGMCHAGGKSCKTLASTGTTIEFLSRLARERQALVHGARTVVDSNGKGRNLASIIGPDGSVQAEYAKIHPFSYGKETERFVGGDTVLTYSWTCGGGEPVTICPAVCYDLRFPELFRRGLSLGATMYVIGANWPAPRAMHWRTLLIARAIENQAFVVGVNRTGSDPALTYSGGSIAVGPKGEILG